jgi:hypothetical protein
VRLYDGAKYLLPMKLKIVDAKKWGLQEGSQVNQNQPVLRNYEAAKSANVAAYASTNFAAHSEVSSAVDSAPHDDEGDSSPSVPLQYRQRPPANQVSPDTRQTDTEKTNEEKIDSKVGSKEEAECAESEEEKVEKPTLPDPITDSPWLQETPDAILRLGTIRLNAANNSVLHSHEVSESEAKSPKSDKSASSKKKKKK